ncbi:hypothetical protein DIS18_08680 [Algibacter marinivivus]|uniref:Uncharacterized protein n=1 Tax=Algibacter marinivivus TaxID=2100723 RepID=A0A2U2X3G2_9FLAO|nr:hypothetical protein [Algibacter marinivivus]PWH82323.1 hypothetical protein DIS18_08680 [Algibacter marinivivus]
MKNLITLFSFVLILSCFNFLSAQDSTGESEDIPKNYKKRSPIYDYSEKQLNNVDTIPDFAANSQKLKVTGTIYENDGVTPAKNVMLFIHHTDENGDFELKRQNKKRYVHHRGWVKTDSDGKYTFYTFVPGKYLYSNELTQILPIIKEPNKPEYKIETFLFDNDPLLTGKCRKKVEETNPKRILTLKLNKEEGLFEAKRDIVLGREETESYSY